MRRISAVLLIGMVVSACTRQQPPTRASLPTVATSSTTAETGQVRLSYGLPPDSVITWNSEVAVLHEVSVTVTGGPALADDLAAAVIVDTATELTLDGVAETAVLATELVDVFTASSGSLAGTIDGQRFDRGFSPRR